MISVLSPTEVHARKVRELGLDSTLVDLTSPEAIAAALRRAAGFLCPCAPSSLVRSVTNSLRGLVRELDIKQSVEETLDAMVAHGDLLETSDTADLSRTRLVLYASPPTFVPRQSGAALLIGVTPDSVSPLPEHLAGRIEFVGHTRRLTPVKGEDLLTDLTLAGLIRLSPEAWLQTPAVQQPADYLASLDRAVEEAPPSGEVPGLTLLDPSRPVGYYRSRWVDPDNQSGHFVGRRRQAYGADLWCYVKLDRGRPERFLDLPLSPSSRYRGCDEAWRIQLAIDSCRGVPQYFDRRQGPDNTIILDFFSPLPLWARRRWDAVGEPVPGSRSLFSYRFRQLDAAEEVQFVTTALWLRNLRHPSETA